MRSKVRLIGGGLLAAVTVASAAVMSVPLAGCCLLWGIIPACGIFACGESVRILAMLVR